MTKKDFIKLADAVNKDFRAAYLIVMGNPEGYRAFQVTVDNLANYLENTYPNFKRKLWVDYVNGKCTANGGKV